MRIVGVLLLFLMISNVGIAQSSDNVIACPTPGVRKMDNVYRIHLNPEKLSLYELDSSTQDSSKSMKQIENTLIISLPNTNAIYLGYDNLIQIGFKQKKVKRYQVECEGCDTLYRLSEDRNSDWVIRANTPGKITLKAINKKGKVLSLTQIPVLELPRPEVYLDEYTAQTTLSELPSQIRLKYDESVPLSVKFGVKRWEIRINDFERFGGYGSILPQNLRDFMQSEKLGTLSIYLSYYGPTVVKEMKEVFEFKLDN